MKNSFSYIFLCLMISLVIASSCSVNRYLPEDKVLYEKPKINLSSKKAIKNKRKVKAELKDVIRPEPNKSILGIKLGLWAHYKAQNKPNFFVKFLNKKIGEEPVFLSDVDLDKTESLIQNRLQNRGYFKSEIKLEKNEKHGTIRGEVVLTTAYRIKSYQVVSDSLPIYREISKTLPDSKLKKGVQFDLTKFKNERDRIDTYLKSKGYYNFNGDFLLFEIDTNQNEGELFNMYLRLKKEVPYKAIIPYQLNEINAYPNYSMAKAAVDMDTAGINQINIIQDTLYFLPYRLEPFILFRPGQLYNPTISKRTSNRLSSIDAYKYVNIQYEETEMESGDSIGKLNTFIYLTPTKKRALQFQLQALTKSNSFSGPTFSTTYKNRNLFKGGEVINFSAEIGYEKQFFTGKDVPGLSSTQLGFKGDLLFPRILTPVKFNYRFRYSVPKTKLSGGIEMLNRTNLYRLVSFTNSFGYLWKSNKYVHHEINPISVNYIRLSNTSPEFNDILNNNIFLKRSFDQELISGLTYNFTFTQLNDSQKKNPWFFTCNFDVAGNSLSLFKTSVNDKGKQMVFGIEYAQYAKLDADLRYYLNVGKKQTLVSRVFAGYGIAYGNSDVLPFSKQYFSGGPFSVRAFRIRSLGPGTFAPANTTGSFFDQSGDIRLESNLEYRFPIISVVKGAVFVDAGNVWLRKENESLPGGEFSSNFINEIGVGSGAGIRIDVQGFVIRFDVAAPVHTPYLPENERFAFRLNKAVLNFALGYPF